LLHPTRSCAARVHPVSQVSSRKTAGLQVQVSALHVVPLAPQVSTRKGALEHPLVPALRVPHAPLLVSTLKAVQAPTAGRALPAVLPVHQACTRKGALAHPLVPALPVVLLVPSVSTR
jgi:hypothetical protein